MSRKQNGHSKDECYYKILPQRLRELFDEQKTSQQEIAEIIGKSRQMVSYYCDGSSTPDWETIVKIAKRFGVSTDYLLGVSDIRTISPDIAMVQKTTGLSENAVMNLHRYSKDELYPKELISRLLSEESFYRIFFKIDKYLELQKMESSETREYNKDLINEIEKNEYIPNEIKLFEIFKNRLSPNELSTYFVIEATRQIESIFRHWGYLEKYEK